MDVYFSKAYASCYSEIEKAEVCEYRFSGEEGEVYYVFLKREIESIKYNGYYDIITPYGYGGPIILKSDEANHERLVNEFSKEFTRYCTDNKIVSEFIRFHPLIKNHLMFWSHYNPEFNRRTVCVQIDEDDVWSIITYQCKKAVRRAERMGVSIRFDFDAESLDDFYKIYTLTMDKNEAEQYYYFSMQYFNDLIKQLPNNLFFVHAIYEDRIIASILFLYSENYIHGHLGGTNPSFYYLKPTNSIISATIQWGIEQGKSCLHLGGGYTIADKDSILAFKKSFTRKGDLCDFYTGKKIYNQKVYDALCEERKVDRESSYFPLYRN